MANTRVVVTEKLANYLSKKGLACLFMDVATCKSCGGAVAELYVRPVAEAPDPTGMCRLPCQDDQGSPLILKGKPVELAVANPRITLDQTVRLDLRRVLGIADVRVTGARF